MVILIVIRGLGSRLVERQYRRIAQAAVSCQSSAIWLHCIANAYVENGRLKTI